MIALVLSIITICLSPIIGMNLFNLDANRNSDDYEFWKNKWTNPDDSQKLKLIEKKRQINFIKRAKAMNGLEHASLICDIFFGGSCALLGLLHYLEVGKNLEKKTGLIGIIGGSIGFILTFVYFGFSAYVFNNESAGENKKFPNGARLKWNGYKYFPNYDYQKSLDDPYIARIKYKELGQKQYNYDSELYKYSLSTEFTSCNIEEKAINNFINEGPQLNGCDNIWVGIERGIGNKYLYDKWITSLFFCAFIILANAGIILFGYFLFTKSESPAAGSTPIPVGSTNAEIYINKNK
jgi:hypothetical protein